MNNNVAHRKQKRNEKWSVLLYSFTHGYFKSSPLHSSWFCRAWTLCFCCPAPLQNKQWWNKGKLHKNSGIIYIMWRWKWRYWKAWPFFSWNGCKIESLDELSKNTETTLSFPASELSIIVKQVIFLSRLRKQEKRWPAICMWQGKYVYLWKLYICACLNQRSSTSEITAYVHNDFKSHQFYTSDTLVTRKLPKELLQAVEKRFITWSLKLHEQEWDLIHKFSSIIQLKELYKDKF